MLNAVPQAAAEAAEAAKAEAARAQAAAGPEDAEPSGPPQEQEADRGHGRGRRLGQPDQAKSSVGNMLGAMAALQQNEKCAWHLLLLLMATA